ncbi:hypothetical protein W97_05856 [Coniosporium apollinis CBS 100218]|uniref:SUN domain-containing protein n=1 Tax=Coniosporium apollinis (strain CBS 100218) TaxID=1168221 RepID=R7YXG9_CONA1|nr:uncharacterized protein W97_05856 [Coniosporium apollinis CBS 100218]EON66610.1 hypothetical protein W97_05856 [Coniosporium apollinis CBS 100218]
MPKSVRYVTLISTALLYASGFAHGANKPTRSTSSLQTSIASPAVSAADALSTSTCQSRMINYITQTLPQQCAKSSWTAVESSSSLRDAETALAADGTYRTGEASSHGGPAAQASTRGIEGQHALSENAKTGTATVTGEPSSTSSEPTISKTSTSTSTAASSTVSPEPEADTESPLDNANFLSFEDWKKQNLAKAGQSPENVGQGRSASSEGRRRPVNINNALDSLGEDTEIELDFGDFGSAGKVEESTPSLASEKSSASEKGAETAETLAASSRARSKDAGKTCKERFNYASFDCAATVLKTNPQCKSSSSVLVENKDSYMLNECAAPNKFIIVELCDDILVDTVVLANFEFFSSMFRTFRISVSDRYPVKTDRWKELGVFEARNSRDMQAFLVENPLIWARYLRVEFLTHYGNEYYCPLSLLRVHGTTMMEEFRHQEEVARGEDDQEDGDIDEPEGEVVQAPSTVPDIPNVGDKTGLRITSEKQQPVKASEEPVLVSESTTAKAAEASPAVQESHQAIEEEPSNRTSALQEPMATTGNETIVASQTSQGLQTAATSADTALSASPDANDQNITLAATPTELSAPSVVSNRSVSSNSTSAIGLKTREPDNPLDPTSQARSTASNFTASPSSVGSNNDSQLSSSSLEPQSPSTNAPSTSAPLATSNGTQSRHLVSKSSPAAAPTTSTSKISSPQSNGSRPAPSSTKPQPANPTTQESFFKSIHKRLQMLEANSTLSLQYIEEQSRILRDAFTKVEKRQLAKTETFLNHLNSSVIAELKGFRQQYDQLWQSTVIELSNHREQHQREMLAISSRLTLLADELVYQKRMSVVQTTLILLCLGLVLFVRSGTSSLEFPLVQQMMHHKPQSSALRLRSPSPPSGSPSPRYNGGGVARRRFRIFRSESSGHLSEGSADGQRSPNTEFEPPTVTSDPEEGAEVLPPDGLREIQSGPATPRGTRDMQPSWNGDEVEGVVARLNPRPEAGANGLRRRSPLRRYEGAEYGSDDSAGPDGVVEMMIA